MYSNLEVVRDRLAYYDRGPDMQFRTQSGFEREEEDVFQKVRQYWADERIPNEVKLLGFEMDLSNFDPRDTTFMELRTIRIGLQALGIIDPTTGGCIDGIDLEFDAMGDQINKDKRVNVFDYYERSLDFLKGYIADGHGFAEGTLVKLNTGITVMRALEERAKHQQLKAGIDIKA